VKIRNLERICEEHLAGRYRIEVIFDSFGASFGWGIPSVTAAISQLRPSQIRQRLEKVRFLLPRSTPSK